MQRKRFSVEQITAILKQAEHGVPVAELCRQHGISGPSYSRWKKACGGMEPAEARELKQLREENSKLKRLVIAHGSQGGPAIGRGPLHRVSRVACPNLRPMRSCRSGVWPSDTNPPDPRQPGFQGSLRQGLKLDTPGHSAHGSQISFVTDGGCSTPRAAT